MFAKKCVKDFRVSRRNIPFIKYNRKTKLFTELRKKIALLKNDDIGLLCDLIDTSDEKDTVYHALGLEKPKRTKVKKTKKVSTKKITLDEFLKKNFTWIEVDDG